MLSHIIRNNLVELFVYKRAISKLSNSTLFNPEYYLERYPDIKHSGMSAIEHYVKHGISEYRRPSSYAESLSDSEIISLLKKAGLPKILLNNYPSNNEALSDYREPKDYNGFVGDSSSLLHELNTISSLDKNQKQSLVQFLDDLFDYNDYVNMHKDLRDLSFDPKLHYFKWGYIEQRLPCSPDKIASKINAAVSECYQDNSSYLEYMQAKRDNIINKKFIVTYHSNGNFFFHELAEYIYGGLIEAGYSAELCNENEISENFIGHIIIVAPHEYFVFQDGKELYKKIKSISPQRTYYVTEQPQSKFGINQMQYLFDGSNVIDINLTNAIFTREYGILSYFLPLGPLKSDLELKQINFNQYLNGIFIDKNTRDYNVEHEKVLSQRPIDILYIANCVPRRASFLAKNANVFNKFNSFIFSPIWPFPHKADSITTLDKNNSLALCQRSKILLNIHRDEFNYFEWHRIVLRGFRSGNVVITEPSYPVPGFVNGTHYLEVPLDEIPDKIEYLLNTTEGTELCNSISRNARTAYKTTYSLSQSLDRYYKFCENI